jgi:anaerobic selenocysteine-containing dehydrogenase
MMNELQGNRPKVFINEEIAKNFNINRGELVEIYNDRGSLKAYAEIDPGCNQNTIIFEEGWWSKYLKGTSYNSLTYPWIKEIHEIYFVPGIWEATTAWNECLVNIRRLTK